MSDFDNKGKKYKGRLLFFAIFVVLIIVFFIAQKNTGSPKQTEVQINLPAPVSEPLSQTPAQGSDPNKSEGGQSSGAGQIQGSSAGEPSSGASSASGQTATGAVPSSTEATPPAKPNRRPTPSKIPVSQAENTQLEAVESARSDQAGGTQQGSSQTAVASGTEEVPLVSELSTVQANPGVQTAQAKNTSTTPAPTQQVQSANEKALPQVASVSIRNSIVHFRFAENKNHIADGAKNALEGVVSSAKSGRYLVISPLYERTPEFSDTKLAEQRILNIKRMLSELSVPEQQIIILKPQNSSTQNTGNVSGERIEVFAVQTNAYSAEQVWTIK